jgi:hypothetical protein
VREQFVDQGVDLRRGEGVGDFQGGHMEVWGGHEPELYKNSIAIVRPNLRFLFWPFPEHMLAVFSLFSLAEDRGYCKEKGRMGDSLGATSRNLLCTSTIRSLTLCVGLAQNTRQCRGSWNPGSSSGSSSFARISSGVTPWKSGERSLSRC